MLIALAAAKGQQVRARGVHPVCILVVLVDEQDDREKDRKHEILQKFLQKLVRYQQSKNIMKSNESMVRFMRSKMTILSPA